MVAPSFGLKLFSVNLQLIPELLELQDQGIFSYVELYVVPDTYRDYASFFDDINLPFIIHSPHFGHGVNLAASSLRESNLSKITDAQRFADRLNAEWIITHGGFGDFEETLKQVAAYRDSRFVLENVPKVGDAGQACVGVTPQDISYAVSSGAFGGFVLDIGHSFCAAASLERSPLPFFQEFLRLDPKFFHLSDGLLGSEEDLHLSIGQGNFPWKSIFQNIKPGSRFTLETPRNMDFGLRDTIQDKINLLHKLELGEIE